MSVTACEKCPVHMLGFDVLYPVKNTVKVQRFLTGFSQGLSQVFSQGKNSQGCMGSDPVKTALFTGSQQFHTL